MIVPKTVRNGAVAVLFTQDYGVGWSSWNHGDAAKLCLFDPEIVAWVESGKITPIPDCQNKFGAEFCDLGADNLQIAWLPQGTRFLVKEYDGLESLVLESELVWHMA